MTSAESLTVGEGMLESHTVITADGVRFDFGVPDGSRRYQRAVRRYIRHRLATEPAFRAAFADKYTRRGKPR